MSEILDEIDAQKIRIASEIAEPRALLLSHDDFLYLWDRRFVSSRYSLLDMPVSITGLAIIPRPKGPIQVVIN